MAVGVVARRSAPRPCYRYAMAKTVRSRIVDIAPLPLVNLSELPLQSAAALALLNSLAPHLASYLTSSSDSEDYGDANRGLNGNDGGKGLRVLRRVAWRHLRNSPASRSP